MNERQKRFCEYYARSPNATEAALEAGYSPRTARSIGQRLLTFVDIQEYLKELQAEAEGERIASMDEVKRFWSQTMRDNTESLKNRLRASELLAKAAGEFLQKLEVSAEIDAEIEEEADVVIYLPDNGRPIITEEILAEISGTEKGE